MRDVQLPMSKETGQELVIVIVIVIGISYSTVLRIEQYNISKLVSHSERCMCDRIRSRNATSWSLQRLRRSSIRRLVQND